MAVWRINNSTAIGGEVCAEWQANHAYALGARCVCTIAYATTARRAFVWECTTAGTSGAAEPAWPTSGTRTDGVGALVWTLRNPNDGDWNNASCYLHYVLNHAAVGTGDFAYVDDGHSEAYGANMMVLGPTVASAPLKILCVDKAADTLSVGAVCGGTGTLGFARYVYSYGVCYKGAVTTLTGATAAVARIILESDGSDVLDITGAATASGLYTGSVFTIINGGIKHDSAGDTISPISDGVFEWFGGTLTCGAEPTGVFSNASLCGVMSIKDVDLSSVGAGVLFGAVSGTNGNFDAYFERCKLHASTTLFTSFSSGKMGGDRIKFHNCNAGNASYGLAEYERLGSTVHETTVVRTGGASDGTTLISLKMVSFNDAEIVVDNYFALKSPPIYSWTASNTEKTFTIEFVHDSATALQNDEIWMEFEYPVNNTDGLGGFARNKCAVLAAAADTTDSAETWTTTGLTNPNTRKLTVTVTPGKAGPVIARVCLAKSNTTVYIDPKITES
jgi:hypothetical protein